MPRSNCPYCGKRLSGLHKIAVKNHQKMCNENTQKIGNYEAIEKDIKIELNESDIVKLISPNVGLVPSLQDDDPYHDVTMISNDGSMATCHAAVLAASSPYFAEMLEDPCGCREDQTVLIVAQNMNLVQIKNLLDFLYLGKIKASKGEVDNMKILLEEMEILFSTEIVDSFNGEVNERIDSDIVDFSKHEIIEESIVDMDIKDFDDFTVEQISEEADKDEDYEPEKKKQKNNKLSPCPSNKPGRPKGTNKQELLRRKLKKRKNKVKHDCQCDYCELKFQTMQAAMKHVQKDHPDMLEDFAKIHLQTQCQYCELKFLNKVHLYSHKREAHPETLPTGQRELYNINDGLPYHADRQCPHCPKILKNSHRYKDHVQIHLSGLDRPFGCDVCEKTFTKSYSVRSHKKKHEISEMPLLCNLCGSTFQTEFDYDEHSKTHVIETRKVTIRKWKRKPVDPNFSGMCSLCGKNYTKKSAYVYHIENAHVDEEKLLKCPHCPQTFTKINAQESHLALHLPPTLECTHCTKKFPTPFYLKRHIRSQHLADNMKDFVCNQCGKGFNQKDAYEGHLNMHAGLKPFKCRYCENSYQNNSNRFAHEKARHPDLYVKKANNLKGVPIKNR